MSTFVNHFLMKQIMLARCSMTPRPLISIVGPWRNGKQFKREFSAQVMHSYTVRRQLINAYMFVYQGIFWSREVWRALPSNPSVIRNSPLLWIQSLMNLVPLTMTRYLQFVCIFLQQKTVLLGLHAGEDALLNSMLVWTAWCWVQLWLLTSFLVRLPKNWEAKIAQFAISLEYRFEFLVLCILSSV